MCGKMLYLNCKKREERVRRATENPFIWDLLRHCCAAVCYSFDLDVICLEKLQTFVFVYRLLTLMLYFTAANKQLQNGKVKRLHANALGWKV